MKKALERIAADRVDLAIIESIRTLDEAECLKANDGLLLAVDADPAIRYGRVQGRRSSTDQVSYEQFLAHEELEKNDPDPHGMQKARVMAMADHVIMNNGTIRELHRAVDEWLSL